MRTAIALFLVAIGAAHAADLSADQDARYQALIQELRCLVCQNQSIAESNAPLAADLRDQVSAQIIAGKSDDEILDYLTARYGDFVRYRPPLNSRTFLLWFSPGLLLIAGLAIAWRVARRRADVAAAPAVDQSKVQELLRRVEEHKS
ncbi:MAG TPA: cytochrome c-type biogenesis protein [Nevskiaceae bacterium]|nr:cytochrome c-type biogenesis protein [Nevskiaceae bacterium]